MTFRLSYEREYSLPLFYGTLAIILGSAAGLLVIQTTSSVRLFIMVAGLISLAAAVARLEWGLLLLIFISYIRFSDIAIHYHGAPSIAKAFVGLLTVAILVRWLAYGEKPQGWGKALLVLGVYGLVGLATMLIASEPDRVREIVEIYAKDVVIAILITILLDRGETFRRVIWSLLAAGIFLGTLSVVQYLTGSFQNNYWGFAQAPILNIVGDINDYRVSGPIGDPNFYAQIMVVLVPLGLDRFWNERKRVMKILAAWAVSASVLAVIFSFSRGGFLALVAVIVAVFLTRHTRPMAVLASLALALVLVQFVPQRYVARIGTLRGILPGARRTLQAEVSFRGRASEFLVGWMMFKDHPVLGVGWDNYPVHYQRYSRQVGLDPRAEERAPHNLYIEIAAETGVFGLAAFLLILGMTYSGLIRARRSLLEVGLDDYVGMVFSLGVGLFGYLVAAMFIHGAYPRYLWVLVGIALAIPRMAKMEVESRRELLRERLGNGK